jgi:Big-like domain-containing protein
LLGLAVLAVIMVSIHDARSAPSLAQAYLRYSEYVTLEHPNSFVDGSAGVEGPTSASIDASALGLSGPEQPIAQVFASTAGVIRFEAQCDPDSHPFSGASGKQTFIQGLFHDTLIFHFPQVIGGSLPPIDVTFNFRAEGFIHGDPASAASVYGGALVEGRFSATVIEGSFYEVVGSVGMNNGLGYVDYGLTTDWGSAPNYTTPYHADPITGFVDTGVHSITYRLHPRGFDWGSAATTFRIFWSASAQGFVYGDGVLDFMDTIGGEIVLPASLPAGVTFTTESGVTPNVRYIGENHAPTAVDQSLSTLEDTSLAVTLTGSDADNNPLTSSLASGPTHGTLTGTPPNLIYTPAANYNGPDSFTFRVNDGTDESNLATVALTITPVNDSPSFTKGANQNVSEDSGPQTIPGWATAISPGPDEAGQTISFVVTSDNKALFSAQPVVSSDGTLRYTPAPNASGVANVSVVAMDTGGTADGGSDTSAPNTFLITIRPHADLNDDSCVDHNNLTILQGQVRVRSTNLKYDLNGDGRVDIADARWLTLHFTNPGGAACSP